MELQTSDFGQYLLINMAAEKTENPSKQKVVQIQKQSVYSYRFQVADDEHGHNWVVRYVFAR